MFNNISWTDYLVAIGVALVIYYVFVGVKYYSDEIREALSGKRKFKLKLALSSTSKDTHGQDTSSRQPETASFENTTNDDFIELEHLIERLKAVIEDASHRKMIPQGFNQYLMTVLKEYPRVANSHLRLSVNELIISECEKYGTTRLNEDEVDMLW